MLIAYWILFYGTIVLAGGVMGYAKKKSKASLIAGCLFGAGLLACGAAVLLKSVLIGIYVALALSVALAGFFGRRFARNRKVMPAGMVLGLSVLSVVLLTWNALTR